MNSRPGAGSLLAAVPAAGPATTWARSPGRHRRATSRSRPADLWRYHELLVRQAAQVVSLGEGMAPLLAMPNIGRAVGVPDLLMKDEGLLPTGTFKRGAAVGVSGPPNWASRR